ncbi:MAG: Mfa1 family fimbria major subunit [Prevotella sp.]|nr:Mfa1 family fimbria major subunit [Bacteroidaceae bacterium]MBR1416087.1 Mfa1 family fimbria major subunit [Prevotella sp.]
MFHSNKTIFALLLACAGLCGCSERNALELPDDHGTESQTTANVVFHLQSNTSSVTRSVEDSYNHVQGTADEYKVNNARVYLFDAPTKLFVKSILLTDLSRSGTDTNGNVVYETERVSVPQGTYDIFVTANSDRYINKSNEAEFLADIDSISYARGHIEDISQGIIMTNRAADNAATVIANNQEGTDNVVNIVLERVMARIDIAKAADSFQLTDNNSRQYATVTLDGHYIVNLPKYYYSFRHAAVLTSLTEPTWNINEHFGNVKDVNGYVIDPYFFNKTIDASKFTNADKYYENFFGDYANPNAVAWTPFKPAANDAPQYNTTYCLENCTLAPAQKNGYSTGVVFRATLEPYNNVYHLGADGNLELVNDKSRYPEVIYYYNYKFYDSAEALASAIGVNSLNGASLGLYQAKKFEKSDDGYRCYYTYWIRHQDNFKATSMGVMEFAIVRNNLYRMLIANVSGLGGQEAMVDPDTPDEGETYLKVVLNVKPWIVRDLTNIVL